MFRRLGRFEITEEEIRESIKAHDICHNNKLSFSEFKLIFFDDNMTRAEQAFNPLKENLEAIFSPSCATFNIKTSKMKNSLRAGLVGDMTRYRSMSFEADQKIKMEDVFHNFVLNDVSPIL